MNFTKQEQTVIVELEKRAGDVLYFEDIAPYFISKSFMQISTYTQTAYIQLGDSMQNALSEYFQVVVFLKKMEESGACFSIPYTPLEDNTAHLGNADFENFQQHTIADGDLLIHLFHYAAKKYVISPNVSDQFNKRQRQSKLNFIIPSVILLLLFLLIGAIGYQSYESSQALLLRQDVIRSELEKNRERFELLIDQMQSQNNYQKKILAVIEKEFNLIHSSLRSQDEGLRSIRYWNKKQFYQLKKLIKVSEIDSIE